MRKFLGWVLAIAIGSIIFAATALSAGVGQAILNWIVTLVFVGAIAMAVYLITE